MIRPAGLKTTGRNLSAPGPASDPGFCRAGIESPAVLFKGDL